MVINFKKKRNLGKHIFSSNSKFFSCFQFSLFSFNGGLGYGYHDNVNKWLFIHSFIYVFFGNFSSNFGNIFIYLNFSFFMPLVFKIMARIFNFVTQVHSLSGKKTAKRLFCRDSPLLWMTRKWIFHSDFNFINLKINFRFFASHVHIFKDNDMQILLCIP